MACTNSPDINPVENVWTWLKFFVEMKIATKQELVQHVQESQHKISPQKCLKNEDSSKNEQQLKSQTENTQEHVVFSTIEAN